MNDPLDLGEQGMLQMMSSAVSAQASEPSKLPPYIYGYEAGKHEKVWTEEAVRALAAQAPQTPAGQDAEDAARWRALVAQHEIDDDQLSHDNYGKTYPKRTFCVFEDDGADGLEPIPCDPGSLVERIDAARKAQGGK